MWQQLAKGSRLTFQIESIESWYADAVPLIYNHWQELGLDTDLKGDINIVALKQLESAGIASVITVRDEGKMAGYLLAIHTPHLHYQSSPPMYIVDMYYIAPEYRKGAGVKLFKFMEARAKKLGCIKMYLSCKVHKDHSKLFEALGYKLSDYAFTKRI